jgi:transposase
MRAYAPDLGARVVRVVAEGRPVREAVRRCAVRVSAVTRYVVREHQTGSLERSPMPGGPRKSSQDQAALLRARRAAAPDATVLEHCAWWAEQQGDGGQQLSEATMWRAIRRLGWTHKKKSWQPASATRRRAPTGVKPRPSSTLSSSSLSTKAARTAP